MSNNGTPSDIQRVVEIAENMTATAFVKAVRVLDLEFGDGFALQHPEFICAFVEAHTALTIALAGSLLKEP